jgi:hypothetical protein
MEQGKLEQQLMEPSGCCCRHDGPDNNQRSYINSCLDTGGSHICQIADINSCSDDGRDIHSSREYRGRREEEAAVGAGRERGPEIIPRCEQSGLLSRLSSSHLGNYQNQSAPCAAELTHNRCASLFV